MQLTDSQEFLVTITGGVSRAGNPVPGPVPGTIAWSTSDDTILTATPSEDLLSCLFSTTGNLGTGVIARATDDLDGDGSAEFADAIVVDVVVGPVAGLQFQVGEPTERQIA